MSVYGNKFNIYIYIYYISGDVWIRGSNNTTPAYFKAGEKMELVCESTQAASWSRQGILLENTPGFTVTRAIVEPRTLTTLIKDVASISDRGPYKCEDGADSFIRDVAIFTSKYCINNTKFDFSLFFLKIISLDYNTS